MVLTSVSSPCLQLSMVIPKKTGKFLSKTHYVVQAMNLGMT